MNLKIALITLVCISLLFSMNNILNAARSEDSKTESQEKKTKTEEKEKKVEINKIFRGRRLLQENINKKTAEWSPFIVPLPTYSSDNGAGFFLLGGVVYNGNKTNPYFEYAPYVLAMVAAASYNQEKQLNYGFSMDLPFFLNSPVNVFTAFLYTETFNMPYYGIGNQTNKHLFTRYGVRYNTYNNYYKRFLNAYDPFNPLTPLYTKPVNYKFNQYIKKQYNALILGTINITKYFILNVGYFFKLFDIDSWAGKKFNRDKARNVISMPTLIDIDPAVMRQKREGLVSRIRLGIAFDTTDYRPDPRNGVLIDYTINISTKYLGADFSFFRHTFGVHGYYSPVRQLTFAARIAYTTTSGSVPFSELGTFSFILAEQSGLGNETTLRGYQAQRFIGRTMTVGNLEVRWEFIEFKLFNQLFALKLIGFVDAGSVFNNPGEPFKVWSHYHIGYGPGFAIAWNQSIILRLYMGFSREDTSIGLNFGHAF